MLRGNSDSSRLTFSVITPTLNRAHLLEAALASVRDQSIPALEHIVVDGGSADGTLEILARHPEVTVLKGPDDGLYDAINKGIAVARGDVLVFLNDDDTLLPNALAAALKKMRSEPMADMFCGRIVIGTLGSTANDVVIGTPQIQQLHSRALASGTNLFNARFIRKTVFDQVGWFQPRYRIIADNEFLARCFLAGTRVVTDMTPVYRYGSHEDSLTFHLGEPKEGATRERLDAALDHLKTTANRRHRRFWLRWVWWGRFYRLVRWPNLTNLGRFGVTILSDPLGLGDFFVQLSWYMRTRDERHGQPLDPSAAATPEPIVPPDDDTDSTIGPDTDS